MTTPLKILLYTAGFCVILFCMAGVGFMVYHEQAAAQQAGAQRAAIEDQAEQARQARIEDCRNKLFAKYGYSPNTSVNAWEWCR